MKKAGKLLIVFVVFCLASTLMFAGCSDSEDGWQQIPPGRNVEISCEDMSYSTSTHGLDVFYREDGNTLMVRVYLVDSSTNQKELISIIRYPAPYTLAINP